MHFLFFILLYARMGLYFGITFAKTIKKYTSNFAYA